MLCFIIIICASVVTSAIDDVEKDVEEVSGIEEYENAGDYRSAAGWLIFVAIMGVIIEIPIIIIRIINISFISNNCTIFGIAVSQCFVCLYCWGYMLQIMPHYRNTPIRHSNKSNKAIR